MSPYGYCSINSLPGFMPRRNLLIPTLCIVLLVTIWTFRFPDPSSYPSLEWLEAAGRSHLPSSLKSSSPNNVADDSTTTTSTSTTTTTASATHSADGPALATWSPPQAPLYPQISSASPVIPGNEIDLSQPDAPFVGWPLQRVCDEATWVDGLVFICDNNSGGIGNIRNYIQTCLRYALEAGATGLVIPKIRKRSEEDIADLFTDYLPFSYMFDEKRFRDAFGDNCPQITLYDDIKDIPGVNVVGGKGKGKGKKSKDKDKSKGAGEGYEDIEPKIDTIAPKDFGNREGCDWQDQNRHTDRFGDTFRKWLSDEEHGHPPSKAKPRLVRFKWGVLWDWQIYRDGPEFAASFGGILKFNDKLLRLGKKTLERMHAFARADGVADGSFLGIHLRSESDALGFWPSYDMQSDAYIEQAQKRGFQTAYLATGNLTEADKFIDGAIEMAQMKIVTKADLLSGPDLDELEELSWDQQGLVDHVVLLGAKFFVGTMPSSFSVYMAMKRHLKTGGLYTRPYKVGTEGDGYSFLVGNYERYWQGWLFMFDGMWP
ncbi:hypothetical protein F5Y16DRAFT_375831 [Xylariaceae sp. FL0255]|nr:hypothetical protein F5Y16DRAFT_375831 [Xylariaceae sp. FL0255]